MPAFPHNTIIRRTAQATHLDCDICVVGAGAAGLSAALEAAALGRQVILADAAPQIGGQAVSSAIGTICGLYSNGPDAERLIHGVMDELISTMIADGLAEPRRARPVRP